MSIAKRIFLLAAVNGLVILTSQGQAADAPSVKTALALRPQQADVEYDIPDAKTLDQCKVTLVKDGKASGWIVSGPAGQPLRRFMDSDGDGEVDQYSYYKNGLEVYRDIISKPNGKKDQFRWLNIGGMRSMLVTSRHPFARDL